MLMLSHVEFLIWSRSRSLDIKWTKIFMTYVMRCAIWYHLYKLRNVKNTHGGVLILVKLQAEACNFTKTNTPPWVFFTFFKLYKWYHIAQRTTYIVLSTNEKDIEEKALNFYNSHGFPQCIGAGDGTLVGIERP